MGPNNGNNRNNPRNKRPGKNNPQHRNRRRPQYQRNRPQGGGPSRRKASPEEQVFLAGTAVNPHQRIALEKGLAGISNRAFDLISPVGMGQRGLIIAPPGAGKTTFLKNICNGVTGGYPDMKVRCVLVDERPEEVTDFRRSVEADVFSSTMDQDPSSHLKMVDEVMNQSFKDAAGGADVLLLVDSLTRLARVHSNRHDGGGRTMSGGVPAGALEAPRRMFGAARNVEGMGSITIIATILINTNSRMDQVIFEEFKGTGNMELVLDRNLAERRVFPAIDVRKSGTRRSELLFEPDEYACLERLYRGLAMGQPGAAMETLIKLLRKHPDNASLLASLKL